MNLLHINDRDGCYPNSWYAASCQPLAPFARYSGDRRADIVIIGGGYTGLSAALHLAESGCEPIVLEAQRVGFGASGRNGGQLGGGQRLEQDELDSWLGQAIAKKLWHLGEAAKTLTKALIKRYKIECDLKMGLAHVETFPRNVKKAQAYVDFLKRNYGANAEFLPLNQCRELIKSEAYHGGIFYPDAGHLHPLAYALGLAKAAHKKGAKIFENSEVLDVQGGRVTTTGGTITADRVLFACNGYLGGLDGQIGAHVMPINNYIVATAPLAEPQRVLTQDIAVADSKFVVNYFRLSRDNRLLFGGTESYGYRFPRDISKNVRRPMEQIFPQLTDVDIDYAWGGTLAITRSRLPYFCRLNRYQMSASGFSGHGVAMASLAGKLAAEAMLGSSDGFETLSNLPAKPFPGGRRFQGGLLRLAMAWYTLRDRIGI